MGSQQEDVSDNRVPDLTQRSSVEPAPELYLYCLHTYIMATPTTPKRNDDIYDNEKRVSRLPGEDPTTGDIYDSETPLDPDDPMDDDETITGGEELFSTEEDEDPADEKDVLDEQEAMEEPDEDDDLGQSNLREDDDEGE